MKKAILIIIAVLAIDQISKIWIKTNLMLGQEIFVFDWFRIHFIENNGAAWGAEIGGKAGKLFLTLFRLGAIVGIGYWLYKSIKEKAHNLLIVSVALIFAGALGNIIDSVLYGIIFDHSNYQLATLFSNKPYGTIFHGKVVDMLYFPMWHGVFPEWVPKVGGENFTFFNAIFNIADSAITIGVSILIVFGNKIFPK
ncbi:lipoprotein signal peptidase [Flavicella sediminum]|uniref:lipoprotein signal peptidase n=1 Tax=Flavicella sediminum TaxID=2585141 RepID=UPI00111E1338|nr:lipoprotein signal peptidase [Flavicella sediminum]